jgi:hypothetical protein
MQQHMQNNKILFNILYNTNNIFDALLLDLQSCYSFIIYFVIFLAEYNDHIAVTIADFINEFHI